MKAVGLGSQLKASLEVLPIVTSAPLNSKGFRNIFEEEGQRWPTRRKNGKRERESVDWFS